MNSIALCYPLPSWRGCSKALLTGGIINVPMQMGKTRQGKVKTNILKNFWWLDFCMFKRKNETSLVSMTFLNLMTFMNLMTCTRVDYCLLSTYKNKAQAVSDSAFEMSTWDMLIS